MGLFKKKHLTKGEIKNKEIEINEKIAGQKVNHILHFLLSIVTAGLWVIVWILVSISSSLEISRLKREREKLITLENAQDKSENSSNYSESIATQITKLAELKEKGLLTEDEFTKQKEKLLNF